MREFVSPPDSFALVFGSDSDAEVFQCNGDGENPHFVRRDSETDLSGVDTIVFPGVSGWSAFLGQPQPGETKLDLAEPRVVLWEDDTPIASGFAPLDVTAAELQILPDHFCPSALGFRLEMRFTDLAPVDMCANYIWSDGRLTGFSGLVHDADRLDVIKAESTIDRFLDHRAGNSPFYDLIPVGSMLFGHPALLQYLGGFLSIPEYLAIFDTSLHRRRSALMRRALEVAKALQSQSTGVPS